jgi:hypothetical protein
MTLKRLAAILACAAVSAAGVRAWDDGQRAPSDDTVQRDRFVLLSDPTPKTLQELNDLAAMGYRVVYASPSDLLLERRPRNETEDEVHYLYPSHGSRADFQSQVNELIAQGSRVVMQAGFRTLMEAPGVAETPTSARRAVTAASGYEYQAITSAGRRPEKDLSHQEFEERLTRAVNDGFRVVDMMTVAEQDGDDILRSRNVLLRRAISNERDRPSAPASVEVKWVEASKKNLEKYSGQGYRLRQVGWAVGFAKSDLLFEKTADSTARPEYAVVEFRGSTPERALNELASRGFRLPRGTLISWCCGGRLLGGVSTLVMEKLPGTELVEYRVMDLATLNAAANQGPIEGAAVGVIALRGRSWDIVTSRSVVLERRLGR